MSRKIFLILSALLGIIILVTGVWIAVQINRYPHQNREDLEKIEGIRYLYSYMGQFASTNKHLPDELPAASKAYEYHVLTNTAFALCATFAEESPAGGPWLEKKGDPDKDWYALERMQWRYHTGKTCFIDPVVSSALESPEARVTLDIFSGLPNPSWLLSKDQLHELLSILSALPATLEKYSFNDNLGYGGFKIDLKTEKGGDVQIIIYRGAVKFVTNNQDIDPFTLSLSDPERKIEQWLLTTNTSLDPKIREEVFR